MPEVQEVFRVATQKVRPDPGALERQYGQQRRRSIRRKAAVYGLVAAIGVAGAIVAVRVGFDTVTQEPVGQPSTSAHGSTAVGTVTFDGSACSLTNMGGITPGVVVFDAVNTSDRKVMFDMYQLETGYRFQEFATTIERMRRSAEKGEMPSGFPETAPGPNQQISYLGSDVIQANRTGSIVDSLPPGTYAIVCLKPYEGLGLQPMAIAGPIVVG
jgi:hypothetical protein